MLEPAHIPEVEPRPWRELERAAAGCVACPRHRTRTRVVFGGGDQEADLMVVAEAPSRQEDLLGRPFLGAAGNVLTTVMSEAGIDRDACYLTTLVKCFGDPPTEEEIAACAAYLAEQFWLVQPRVVVTLGPVVTRALLGRDLPLERIAGVRFDLSGATLIPTFSLVDAVRGDPRAMAALRRDFHVARAVLDGRLPTGAETLAALRGRVSGR